MAIVRINSLGITDGTIVNADINASAAIASTKLSGVTSEVKAWVNFNGTGTVAIRGSGNVTSITDNGTGNYTVNFTNALTDTNYAFVGSVERDGVTGISTINDWAAGTKTTSAFQLSTQRSGSVTDYAFVWCGFLR
jgi:uncharacterized protein (AIM24 family)